MVIGKGDKNIQTNVGEKWDDSYLSNVLKGPELNVNLFLWCAYFDKSFKMVTDKNEDIFTKSNCIVEIKLHQNK